MRKQLSLILVHDKDEGQILLGMKKRGFGAGRWNGFGGKVEPGESLEDAARRELMEEAGVRPRTLEKRGVIEFTWEGQEELLEVHIFHAAAIEGEPGESEEMLPAWYALDEIPFPEMWPGDRYWFPLFLAGKSFVGKFHFGPGDTVLHYELNETPTEQNIAIDK